MGLDGGKVTKRLFPATYDAIALTSYSTAYVCKLPKERFVSDDYRISFSIISVDSERKNIETIENIELRHLTC